MIDKKILRFLVSFLLAIAVASFFPVLSYTTMIFWIIACVLLIAGFFAPKSWLIVPILIGAILGFIRFEMVNDSLAHYPLDRFAENQTEISIVGFVDSSPEPNSYLTRFILKSECIQSGDACIPLSSNIRVSTDSFQSFALGDRVLVSLVPEKPEAFQTDTGRIFDYEQYLYKDNIQYTASYAQVEVLDGFESGVKRSLFLVKERFLSRIYELVPRPESGLLAGVLFGEKTALDDEYKDQFRIVGLMHIIVLSGYNVSLVIYGIMFLLRFLPLYIRSIIAVTGIVAFAILVGAGPTVIRASIMALLIVLAKVIGRKYNIERSLLVAGCVMVAWNPLILVFDISFQLSFLATYGLIVFTPFLEPYLKRIPKQFALRESVGATIAAQIFVLPLLLYSIGEFSLVSVLVNMLVLWAVPLAMLFGFVASLLAGVIPFLGTLFSFLATIFLKYILLVVDFFAGLPFALLRLPPFHWIFMVLLYGLLYYWIRRLSKRLTNQT